MGIRSTKILKKLLLRFFGKTQQCKDDQSGTAGIEFAMIIGPFLLLVFGIMKIGIIFFAMFSLDNAVEQTARLVRTGQAGTISKSEFKNQVCARVPSFMDCAGALRVDVQSNPE